LTALPRWGLLRNIRWWDLDYSQWDLLRNTCWCVSWKLGHEEDSND